MSESIIQCCFRIHVKFVLIVDITAMATGVLLESC